MRQPNLRRPKAQVYLAFILINAESGKIKPVS